VEANTATRPSLQVLKDGLIATKGGTVASWFQPAFTHGQPIQPARSLPELADGQLRGFQARWKNRRADNCQRRQDKPACQYSCCRTGRRGCRFNRQPGLPMTEIPNIFPFTKLQLGQGEVPRWVGFHPTFHRFFTYGLVISDVALYVCSRAWLFASWRRYRLENISEVTLASGRGRPTIRFRAGDSRVTFSTPWDFYGEEMEFDRSVLSKAVALLTNQSAT
jgi:hypothetical protein